MRLLSITVKNYRLHQEKTVVFDRARTLIGGPNESGKSTLVEAAHRALFMKAKTGGRLQQSMRSTLHTGHPEVALSFEARGQTWHVEKRFSGASGQTRLNLQGGQSWQGDEAETRLAELLGTEPSLSTQKQLDAQWPHLWVWQGSSGNDPSDQATEHRDVLVQRLQQEGLGAVMQSDFDQQVRERITASYLELFTPTNGKLKAGSKPEQTRLQLEEAQRALTQAQEASQRLEQAVKAFHQAETTLKSVDAALPALQKQKLHVDEQMLKVRELRAREQQQSRELQTATDAHESLRKEHQQLADAQQQAALLEQKLQPLEKQLAEINTQLLTERANVQQQEIVLRDHASALREARLKTDCASSFATLLERSEIHAQLSRRHEEASKIQSEINRLRDELHLLPAFKSPDLAKLRAYESTLQQAGAALNAMAAGLTLVQSKQSAIVDGEPLQEGEKRHFTKEVEIIVGDDTRLLLSPGGGTSLNEARAKAAAAQHSLQQALDHWVVRDVADATQKFEQAQALRQTRLQLTERWRAMGGESLNNELETASAALEKAKVETAQRQQRLSNPLQLPDTLAAAQQLVNQFRQEQQTVDDAEATAAEVYKRSRQQLDKSEQQAQQQTQALTAQRQQLDELRSRIRFAEDRLGDAETRQKKLQSALDAETALHTALQSTQTALQTLQPELLEGDLARFTRSIQTQEQQRREAETQLAVARSQLVLDGRIDPQAELQQATAKVAMLTESHTIELRRARAIERLHHLFNESRESIDRHMVQPLADRISGYLQCIFGSGSEAKIQVSDQGRMGLEISRAGESSFGFEALSGGAKEQVAAAVRLAMAELLAAGHDGCLPLVFDDAFAYADPQRVVELQRMLELAACRGLQIIVLSCDPAGYSAFGAEEVRLG